MKLLRIFALVLLSLPAFAATKYIANGGNDAAAGTKVAPWAHAPGMKDWTGSYSPAAGDSFIFKGGDTWTNSSVGTWTWSASGNSTDCAMPYDPAHATTCIYLGVDKTWYSGGAWARPIFTCSNNVACSQTMVIKVDLTTQYVVLDNFEITGIYADNTTTADGSGVWIGGNGTGGAYVDVENFYVHGFSHSVNAGNASPIGVFSGFSGYGGGAQGSAGLNNSYIHDNVVDGADGPQDMGRCAIGPLDKFYNNICRYLPDHVIGGFNDIHGNLIEYITTYYSGSSPAPHCDGIFQYVPLTAGGTLVAYNNVVRHLSCAGGLVFWVFGTGNGGPGGTPGCASCTAYVFNNVIYDIAIADVNGIALGGHGPSAGGACSWGTIYAYNNTVESGAQAAMMNGEDSTGQGCTPNVSYRTTTHYANNHAINSLGSVCAGPGTNCVDDGTSDNLVQTTAQAATHYNGAGATFAYSPKDGSAEGIALGLAGNSATWTTFAAAAGTASLSDTDFACTDISNVSTCPARTALLRPANATKIDAGAYMYTAGVTAPTCTLVAAPLVIKTGTSSTLTFAVANTPTVCSIDNGVGNVSCSGATPSVSPTTATTYTATVTNAGGSNTCSATVTIGGCAMKANIFMGANSTCQ